MNVELKRLDTCSFQTAVDVWNEGFKGYFVDLTLTLEKFLARLVTEGVSPEHSFIAYFQDRPVGFLLNAIRQSSDRKLAWNGGTGVIPEFRGQGIGRRLVNAALELYVAEGVDIAMLEAVSTNRPAISLYERCGYNIVDELTFLHCDSSINTFVRSPAYDVRPVSAKEVGSLSFYRHLAPWQSQWFRVALQFGEAIVVIDRNEDPAGYALFTKQLSDNGDIASISLYQCEVAPDCTHPHEVTALALERVYTPGQGKLLRRAPLLPKANQLVLDLLINAGFTPFIKQVQMIKNLKDHSSFLL